MGEDVTVVYRDGEWVVPPSEPFWVRSPLTLFRWRPACFACKRRFRNRAAYYRHWFDVHHRGATRG